ncbi:hypothetical protein OE88DRAFT_283910 [Heliocybe sulcata]|uniref:Uncharacterized protein n=1 Tax=Heliocybe sulcata TaxID=5364 RepID=A0A5C3N033_9AGAM|nr:hypothetical protein OE88DRAFT_283910 [Heliocybe sulcata]
MTGTGRQQNPKGPNRETSHVSAYRHTCYARGLVPAYRLTRDDTQSEYSPNCFNFLACLHVRCRIDNLSDIATLLPMRRPQKSTFSSRYYDYPKVVLAGYGFSSYISWTRVYRLQTVEAETSAFTITRTSFMGYAAISLVIRCGSDAV